MACILRIVNFFIRKMRGESLIFLRTDHESSKIGSLHRPRLKAASASNKHFLGKQAFKLARLCSLANARICPSV
jgi:hypothetical protein